MAFFLEKNYELIRKREEMLLSQLTKRSSDIFSFYGNYDLIIPKVYSLKQLDKNNFLRNGGVLLGFDRDCENLSLLGYFLWS